MRAWNEEKLNQWKLSSVIADIDELRSWQEQASRQFLESGFPSRKVEDWKYTPVAIIAEKFHCMADDAALLPVELDKYQIESSYRIVFVNGVLDRKQSHLQDLPDNVVIAGISDALNDPILREHIKLDEQYQTVFSQLNTVLMGSGVFIHIPKGVTLKRPIHFLYYSRSSAGSMLHPRNLIIGEANSQFVFVEEYAGDATEHFNNIVTAVYVRSGASCSHYKIQDESHTAYHIANTVLTQEKDSSVVSCSIALGAKLSRDNLNFNLIAEGASCHLYGLSIPMQFQHIDYHTRVDHRVPHCFSRQIHKSVVGHQGHSVFNGKVMVHPGAQKTSAYQNNQNLLLSDRAEVDTKPELEIYADDVKCTHGATIGQLDDKSLFYLRSRGIAEDVARHILTRAFVEEVLMHIPQQEIAHYINNKLEKIFLQEMK